MKWLVSASILLTGTFRVGDEPSVLLLFGLAVFLCGLSMRRSPARPGQSRKAA
jgi:hypothetical protein